MSFRCEVCDKKPSAGHKVSHANKKANRWWRPNVQEVRVAVRGGTVRKMVCTGCLRAGKVVKAVHKAAVAAQ